MAPFPKVKAVLVKILTYHNGKRLAIAGTLKGKQTQGISHLILNVPPQNTGSYIAHSDLNPQWKKENQTGEKQTNKT